MLKLCLKVQNKEPEKWQFKFASVPIVETQGDCADAKDWGVSTTSSVEIGDEGSQNVNSLF